MNAQSPADLAAAADVNTTGFSMVPAASIVPPFSTASDAPSAKRISAPALIVRTVEEPRTRVGASIWYGTPAFHISDALIAPLMPTVPSAISVFKLKLFQGYAVTSYPVAPS